ncbi:MAG: hypothetical protein AAF799_47295 [Myxococcota bacterium]
MHRRSFVKGVALAAPAVTVLPACKNASCPEPAGAPASSDSFSPLGPILGKLDRPSTFSIQLVDDETPFASTTAPYFMALLEDGQFRTASGLRVALGPGYGRDGGVVIDRQVTVAAPDRESLEAFFDSREAPWQLPSTHQIRYGPRVVPGPGSERTVEWQAYVVRSRVAVTREHVIQLNETHEGVEIKLDRIGARALAELSADNVGRKAALIVGDLVLADPVFNEAIANGELSISFGHDIDVGHHSLYEALMKRPPTRHG